MSAFVECRKASKVSVQMSALWQLVSVRSRSRRMSKAFRCVCDASTIVDRNTWYSCTIRSDTQQQDRDRRISYVPSSLRIQSNIDHRPPPPPAHIHIAAVWRRVQQERRRRRDGRHAARCAACRRCNHVAHPRPASHQRLHHCLVNHIFFTPHSTVRRADGMYVRACSGTMPTSGYGRAPSKKDVQAGYGVRPLKKDAAAAAACTVVWRTLFFCIRFVC